MFGLKNWSLCVPIIFGLGAVACEGDEGRPVYDFPTESIWQLAEKETDLSTFVTNGKAAGIDLFLSETQATFTVLAPSNSAFSGAAGLSTDPAELNALLRFHILAGYIDSALLKIGGEFRTITSTTVRIEPDGSTYTVIDYEGNVAKFTKTDIYATNGVLSIIDRVLTPPPAPVAPRCGDGNMDAGEACDDGNTADGDGCSAMCMTETVEPGTLAEVLQAEGFAGVVMAVMGTPVADLLAGTGPYTVFAPNDAALGQVPNIEMVDTNVIQNVILHHIVAGTEDTTALEENPTLTSLAGLPLAVTANGATVGGAEVGDNVDIEASNGIAHELNEIIVPPTAIQYADTTADLMRSSQAAAVAGVAVDSLNPSTLTGADPVTVFFPNNAAWTAGGFADVSMVATATLANILEAHTTAGQVLIEDLLEMDGMTLTMLNGSMVTVEVEGDTVTLVNGMNEAVINTAASDKRTLTGAVHVVSALLDDDNTPN